MKFLGNLEKYFLVTLMLFSTLLLFVNVVMRNFFHTGVFWSEELIRYLIVWITFIGASTCAKKNAHISIDLLANILKGTSRKILDIFLRLVGILFSTLLLYYSVMFITQISATGQVSATIGNVPMYIIYLCFPIGFFLYLLRSIAQLISILRATEEEGLE